MKRRQLIRYGGTSLLTAIGILGSNFSSPIQAQSGKNSVTITYLGHTCFLFSGNGIKVLVNPFLPLGCTAGYKAPTVVADLVLISSFLLDEGAIEEVAGNPQIITNPGDYKVKNIVFKGISTPHDLEGGRRFGQNIAWRWNQGGVNLLHLGGAAAPISLEEQILMGSPDVLLLPVGGGVKAYNPEQAMQAIEVLKPRVVIPTQYLTNAADKENCDLVAVDDFLALTKGVMESKKLNTHSIAIKRSDLPKDKTVIRVLTAKQ
ncbi:putative Zn-dependent hydrolase of beta-lactamase fold [Xenococcus sp. PCC 7305]|uniref:MBL fold metallo-hydrolase n=1 Tax=Xenococcus sp. PCC 7305 TaxID=102125 RepID=UPI0002ACE274|nr:MBL fold metallo-hydrolase [Xenococcus sp. PCC 7305]ELS04941.1 putative Zn-dependent hydrolase of beta-lactamase fold [Xenococcus sp. PCC 7305]